MKNKNFFSKGKYSKKSNLTNLKMLRYSGFFDKLIANSPVSGLGYERGQCGECAHRY